jgi:hypothetical protein
VLRGGQALCEYVPELPVGGYIPQFDFVAIALLADVVVSEANVTTVPLIGTVHGLLDRALGITHERNRFWF